MMRKLSKGCGVALLGAALVSVARADESAPALKVYGNTSTLELAPVLLAADRIYPGKATVTNGGVPNLFKEGEADVATNAETQALRASVDNPSLRIIFTVSEGFYRIVARRSAGIAQLADLRGKKIATIPNTSSAYYLHKMLKTVGLTENDVTVVRMLPLDRMPPALKSGEVDAVTIWEPEIERAQELLGDDAIEFQDRGVYRELFNLHTTAEKLADPARRREIVAFVRALVTASERMRKNPREVWPMVARSTGYDEALISRVWHHEGFAGGLAYDMVDVLVEEEVWVAKERNRQPRTRAQLAAMVDTSVLRDALAPDAPKAQPPLSTDPAELQQRVQKLAADVANAEGVRAVKRLQHVYGHYTDAGMWNEVADLFAKDAVLRLASANVSGRESIRKYFLNDVGRGRLGLERGRLNTELMLTPVVTLSADGHGARGRWHAVSMLGDYGKSASWAGGIYENEYVREDGRWRISKLHYYPQYAGPYEGGWRNVKKEEKVQVVPYHYTPDGAGTPTPLDPVVAETRGSASVTKLGAHVRELEASVRQMTDAAQVQNLQHALGFYLDRRMWDDVVDLFADDGTFESSQRGVYVGKASIRRMLNLSGPQGLGEGEINDQLQLQTVVTVAPDGNTARARGTQLAMLGTNGKSAFWSTGIFENQYAKQGGVWKLRSVRVYSRMRTDYFQGWAKNALPADGPSAEFPADRAPTSVYANYPEVYVPPFHFQHPVTGQPVRGRAMGAPRSAADLAARIAGVERQLEVAKAYDGTENVVNAYGYYIDEFLWTDTSDLFAKQGWKELSYIGTYVGHERVRDSMIKRYGNGGRRANFMAIHQKTQPVINISPDGQSTKVRTRLLQINSALDGDGSYMAGIYENRAIRENGIWKIQGMDLDYTWTCGYKGGWARVEPNDSRRFAPQSALSREYPPDRPLRGVQYAPFPKIDNVAFHYRNPVSGRPAPAMLPE